LKENEEGKSLTFALLSIIKELAQLDGEVRL
jgi:hypothetical protein